MTTDKMIRIGAINYINSLPFFAAFQQGAVPLQNSTLVYDVPTALNRALRQGQLDAALISSAEYIAHRERYTLISDSCIGAEGPVMSVLLYVKAEMPIAALHKKKVALTSQSASSSLLLKVLCHHFWHVEPELTVVEDIDQIMQHEAFLLIGDSCLANQKIAHYHTVDLAAAWHTATQLPFTFAVFAANNSAWDKHREMISYFNTQLLQAKQWAINHPHHIEQCAMERCSLSLSTIRHYYKLLKYDFNAQQRAGLQKFQELAADVQ